MRLAGWMKQIGISLVVVAMLAGVTWADPSGTANVFQIVGATTGFAGVGQETFQTIDPLTFRTDYYDPNPACDEMAPVFAQLFLFDSRGVFVQQFSADNGPGLAGGSKYRGVFKAFTSPAAIGLTPGTYTATFLVRDCTNTNSIVLAPFLTFRVVAP